MFEIGNSLREARHRRSIDFARAEAATKVRAKYLRALEEERFDQLPSETYVKGFLRTYADFLGLDGQLYVDEFNSRFVAGVGSDLDARPRRSTVRPERRNRRAETNIVLVALALITVVTVVVISAWQGFGSGQSGGTTTPKALPKQTKTTHVAARYALAITGVKGPSYVEVHRKSPSGALLFQGTIGKGQVEPFHGAYFWVTVSSPENLVIKVHGGLLQLTGLKPKAITVTPRGVRTN